VRTQCSWRIRKRTDITQNHAAGRKAPGFEALSLRSELLHGVAAAGFTEPRPIQSATIPAVLEGRDVLGLAQTGTGKTAAFVLPILERLMARRGQGPRALVVAPTRELATQIQAELDVLAEYTPITSTSVFGGVSANRQIQALRRRPDVLVACPGRLLDLHGQGAVRLDRVEVLVLDEADHMLDMGFLPDIERILKLVPARRQNLLFSATMPPEIRRLADRILNRPHVVELARSTPAETVEHALLPVADGNKVELLQHLLERRDFSPAIVFVRTKHRARRLAQRLEREGHSAVALQGNMSQGQRDRAMGGFRSGAYEVLVATDIAARGIDVAGVAHVVNFDVPITPDAYTHRIGRTGRSEQSGRALTFATPGDAALVRAIEKRIGEAIERRKIAGFTSDERWAVADCSSAGRSTGGRSTGGRSTNGQPSGGRGASRRRGERAVAAAAGPQRGGRRRGGRWSARRRNAS
jgi:ATP-dependent RNA helicase RhlE